LLEAFHCAEEGRASLGGERVAFQIKVVRVYVGGCRAHQLAVGLSLEGDLELGRDDRGDFVLDGEYVVQLPIVSLRPEMVAVGHVDQLSRDADPPSGPPHAAFEYGADVQLVADGPKIDVLPLE